MLHLHRAERADALVDALGVLLGEAPTDPFAADVVAVPTRGVERWLAQRLSATLGATAGRRDGVAANVEFPTPRALVEAALATATGLDPDDDRWAGERPVWPLLEAVDAALEEPWLAPVARHLGDPADPGAGARRFGTVRHLAGLFATYGAERPALIAAWAAGEDDGWQARLWRRLRERIGTPSPAERLPAACELIAAEPDRLTLPGRLAVFGLTRLPAAQLRVLRALAAGRDVHLLVLHPSPALWDAIHARPGPPPVRRADDDTGTLATNPLLASWGRDARELQLLLDRDPVEDHHATTSSPAPRVPAAAPPGSGSTGAAPPPSDSAPAPTDAPPLRSDRAPAPPVAAPPPSLLARLQADVRADRAPRRDDPDRPRLDPADRSVTVHACHGRARQVEVLRDELLHRLAADSTLEPRDIVVLCPDIETYAPLVHATFGAADALDEQEETDHATPATAPVDLRVRLADRALRHTTPLLGTVARLLELAESRLTVTELLDLADREPVRRRFGLDDDDLTRLGEWAAQAGVRWGLDAAHRAPYHLARRPEGTWATGLDRLLLGVAMPGADATLYEGVLPLEDVDSGSIELAGRVAELVARLRTALDALGRRQSLTSWAAAIGAAADALTLADGREAWQRLALGRILDTAVADAGPAADAALSPAEVRALLRERLQGRPTRGNFRTGQLTVCTLVPMRSVPHRVVCLLGLDDGAFPRKAPRDGDDLLLADPHVGDRDPRAEDRQQLLDALMAAGDALIVTYGGRDVRTNAELPPAVCVGELLDAVDGTVRDPKHPRARDRIVTHHPLQPFDPRNFEPGALRPGEPASFDGVLLDGARALTGPRRARPPFLAEPLPALPPRPVELPSLVAFARAPVRAFLRTRLDVAVGRFDDEPQDRMPVELDGLGRYQVGERLLGLLLDGVDRRAAYRAEIARGTLPPGHLAEPVVNDVLPVAERIAAAAALPDPARSVDVRVTLGDGRELRGTVPAVCGDTLRWVSYASLSARHRITAWVQLLALTAADPQRPWTSLVVGRQRREAVARTLGPLGATPAERRAEASRRLAELVDLFDRGLREPAPLALKTSAAFAAAGADGEDPQAAAARAWDGEWDRPGEGAEPEHRLVHGGVVAFATLLDTPPRPDEAAWETGERSRFGAWARRLWAPQLEWEARA